MSGFDSQSLRDRQISVEQTPIHKARQNQPSTQAPSQALLKAKSLPTDVQQASYVDGNGANAVAAAQYVDTGAEPRGLNANTSMPNAMPRTGSVPTASVPRIPMGPQYQTIAPNVPVKGSPYHPASYPQSGDGHNHSAGCSCGNHGKGSGRYVPVYPQKTGGAHIACSVCGSDNCGGSCTGGCNPTELTGVPRMVDPQEYIYDGGDRDPEVRLRPNLTQTGLDPEDTVIQYKTADGQTLVDSGCRVAIYAPRFASVRKRTTVSEKDLAMRAVASIKPDGPNTIRDQLPPLNVSQPVKPQNKENVRVVEAFRDRSKPIPTDMVLPMLTVSDAFKPFEDLALIRNGDLKATDLAKLAKSTAAARGWTNVDELNVFVDGQETAETKDTKQPADVTLYELKGARIRLCKIASEQIANPGDTISFTIRFDNVGEQSVSNIVITDSLAPRLEYVANSQQSSLAANFSTTPNEAGSVVLRWELENTVKPGEGGLVRFSTIVR